MEVAEKELIVILFAKPELIDSLQIKPKYLKNEKSKKIVNAMVNCYKQNKIIELSSMCNLENDFPIDDYIDIITNDGLYTTDYESQFKLVQKTILDNYKKTVIEELYLKFKNEKLTYEEFQEKMDKIGKIQITVANNSRMKGVKDIDTSYEERTYIKSGSTELNQKIKGYALGELSVWSGSNASAKSTYLNQVALEAISSGFKVAVFSGELTDRRLLNWITFNAAGKTAKEKILNWLDGKLFIYDNNYGNDAKDILQSVENCIKRNDVKMVILDNLMSMNLSKYGDQKYDMQTKLITELSELAKRHNVHIHFVCHPRKSTAFLRKVDISGSADLTNIADNVLIMHRVNEDFKKQFKDLFKNRGEEIFKYSNVIEVCKNREFGVQDLFVGLYFEKESKRLLNTPNEEKKYGWES